MWEILFLPGGRARLCHYSTQSRETTTREGGRQQKAVRKQSGSVLPPVDLQVKGEHKVLSVQEQGKVVYI